MHHGAPTRSHLDSVLLARREFLRACGLLATALSGCRTLAANMQLGADLVEAPHPDRVEPIVQALIIALLPCEERAFPVKAEAVAARLVEYFAPYDDPELDALRRALVVFDDASLFPERLALFTDAEREALQASRRFSSDAVDTAVARALTQDGDAFLGFRRRCSDDRFGAMQLADARAYLQLWSHSGFSLRRRFYRSTKTLIMLSAYSLPGLWQAIGYEGPLLEQG